MYYIECDSICDFSHEAVNTETHKRSTQKHMKLKKHLKFKRFISTVLSVMITFALFSAVIPAASADSVNRTWNSWFRNQLSTDARVFYDAMVQMYDEGTFKTGTESLDLTKAGYISQEKAAAYMNMNTSYFSRFFHKLTGITFCRYLNHIRTEKAIELLRAASDASVTEISNLCGFTTIRNFNRIFKCLTGYAPKSLPKDFILKTEFSLLNENSADPNIKDGTLVEDIR